MDEKIKFTKYEKARIIGARALQLSMGAPFLLKLSEKDLENLNFSSINVAKLEFEKEVIPIAVRNSVHEMTIPQNPIVNNETEESSNKVE